LVGNRECNTKRGFKNQLYIELGINLYVYKRKFKRFKFNLLNQIWISLNPITKFDSLKSPFSSSPLSSQCSHIHSRAVAAEWQYFWILYLSLVEKTRNTRWGNLLRCFKSLIHMQLGPQWVKMLSELALFSLCALHTVTKWS